MISEFDSLVLGRPGKLGVAVVLDSGMVAWVGGRDCGWSGAEGTGVSEAVGSRLVCVIETGPRRRPA